MLHLSEISGIPQLSDFIQAAEVLSGVVKPTLLEHSKSFSTMADANVYLKLENLQSTGSFKVRGAYNKLYHLSDEEKKIGVVAASAGNHAQGVAYSATKLGIKSTIFMPLFTPSLKVIATRAYGAEVILQGSSFDDAFAAADAYCKEHNKIFIHPYDDPYVISGQATVGIEIFNQLREVDTVIVPIGGGGLIAGIAMAIKSFNPNVRIVGVEAEAAASMKNAIEHNKIIQLDSAVTIADGIAVKRPGSMTYQIVKQCVDELITVSDAEIAHVLYLLLQRSKQLAEPSGVASLAALLFNKSDFKRQNVVPVISGGNINMSLLGQILEKGMLEEGLKVRIATVIPDQAGELKKIITILDTIRANIMDIRHERSITSVPVGYVMVIVTFGVQESTQIETIKAELTKKNLEFKVLK